MRLREFVRRVTVDTRTQDFFSFLGLSRKLKIDMADLEQRYRALSRQFHPDYFYNAPPAERRASVERSSYLNDAYRTLKNPASRIEYLLKLEKMEGRSLSAEARSNEGRAKAETPPPALLEEVFALNEELDEIREDRESGAAAHEWKARLDRAREPIERKRAEHEAALEALSARWDALVDASAGEPDRRRVLDELQERMLERTYISNLLAGIERELSQ
jgi:molecular chaperone HscB